MFGIRTSNEWPYGRVAAGCRRYIRYVNGMRNVAAMIHRQPAPPRGWPRWMLRIRTSNEWPYGQWRQVAAATPGTVNGKPNVAAMIHRQPAPARGWPSLDVMNTNVQRVALRPGGGRLPPLRPVRKRYTQCSGDDSSPASTGEGLAPLDVWNTNIQRVALRPGGGRLPPLHPVRLTINPM